MKKILIVEDEEALMEAMATGLSESGFTVLKAGNGEVGLKMALEEHPDLILLDIIMPIMIGVDMLKRLREDKWGKDAKVILLTVLNDLDKIQTAVEHDVANYLMKQDWKVEDIIVRIKQILKIN